VYATACQPSVHPDRRVTPLTLDVTDIAQIDRAVDSVESLDLLINDAGISLCDDLSDRSVLEQHLPVNLFGLYAMTQAFLPLLSRSGGATVNNVSMMALGPVAADSGLRGTKGCRLQPDAIAACPASTTWDQGARSTDRSHRYRYEPRLPSSEGTLPSPWLAPSSTEWKPKKKTSSPTPDRKPRRISGATEWPMRSSTSMRHSCNRRLRRQRHQ
jgi:hypothetical protein